MSAPEPNVIKRSRSRNIQERVDGFLGFLFTASSGVPGVSDDRLADAVDLTTCGIVCARDAIDLAKISGGRDADRERSARSRQRRKRGTLNVTFARCQATETACYWLITTRRAVSSGFDHVRNVERDDARDLARALSNPGRAVCWWATT